MLDELREVCAREARRSDSEAQSLYQDRLREQLERKMMQPYCMPYVEGGRKHLRKTPTLLPIIIPLKKLLSMLLKNELTLNRCIAKWISSI